MQDDANNDDQDKDDDPWIPLGGGAINEKKRLNGSTTTAPMTTTATSTSSQGTTSHYDPSSLRSHLWHALEGLDRYPNYLSRWSERDADRLEKALEEKLSLVRQQRQTVRARRDGVQQLVELLIRRDDGDDDDSSKNHHHHHHHRWNSLLAVPKTWEEVRERILDPAVSRAIFSSKMFKSSSAAPPLVEQVLRGEVDVQLDVAQLQELMDEELFDVYSFQLLSREFCRQLREYVTALADLGNTEPFAQQLHVGRRPLALDSVGLGWLNDLLFHLVVRPISRHLFQSTETKEDLDWRHGFVAGYSATPGEGKPRERLVTHTDDAEVTLNVGLGARFEGGVLEFRGLRGTTGEGQLHGTFQPREGLALLHAGRHFHDVTQVTEGDRFALILWARSWKGERAQLCPCCWLNRRRDNDCVCGPRWN